MHKNRSKYRIVVAGWVAAVVSAYVFCWPAAHGHGLIGTDIYRYFMPLHTFYHDELQAGRFPLWNPYLGFGVDVVAESQSGVFYPPNLILYGLLDVGPAHNAALLLHLVLAFGFLFHYLRMCGVSAAGGILGGFVFTYGFLLPRIGVEWHYVTGAWIPAVLIGIEGYLQGRGRRWLLLTSAAFAVQLSVGHFQYAFTTILIALLLSGFRRATGGKDRAHRRLPMVAAGFGLAFVLAAAQILPTWQQYRQSNRSDNWDPEPASGQVKLWYAPQLVFPWHFSFVNPDRLLMPADTNEGASHVFVGLLPVFLCLVAGWVQPRREQLAGWLAVGAAGVILSACATWPVIEWIWSLPGFRYFNAPGRYYVMTALALAVCSGFGFDCLTSAKSAASIKRAMWTFIVPQALVLLATVGVILVPAWKTSLFERGLRWYNLPAEANAEAEYAGIPNPPAAFDFWLFGGLLVCVAVIVLVGSVVSLRRFRHLVLAMALVCGLVEYRWITAGLIKDAIGVDWRDDRVTSATFVEPPGPIGYREESTVRPLVKGRLWGPDRNVPAMLDVSTLPVYLGLGPYWYTQDDLILNVDVAELLTDHRRWMRLCGVEFILTLSQLPDSPDIVEVIPVDYAPFLRRIWVDPENSYVFLHRIGLPASDGSRKSPSRFYLVSRLDSDEPLPQASIVDRTLFESKTDLSFDVDSPDDGYFVLADLHYPGWQAFVNDEEVTIQPYQQLFRAVPISAGRSEIRFLYRPAAVYVGLGVSVIAWVALGAVVWGFRRVGRREAATA